MLLRPYQTEALAAIAAGWVEHERQLLVAACGAGKTVIASHVAKACGGRVLILAHRQELITQAVEKLRAATGIFASVECGSQRAMPGHGVIVGSVQSLRRRLGKYAPNAFDLIIVDECHHIMSDEYLAVMEHFKAARVLGITATPGRSDRRRLGSFFQSIAYEVGILKLIADGYLCPLRALKLDVELDARHLRVRSAEITADEAAELVSPRLQELAKSAAAEIWDRKTVSFLPRRDVSTLFAEALRREGIDARHVDGASIDREELLAWFRDAGPGSALVNPQLLTEGWDEPSADCILCLRATKSREMYQQIVGRGMRPSPGKEFCLLLDPLWLSGEIDLCKPADLVAPSPLHRDKLQTHLEAGLDLLEAEKRAAIDVEAVLAEQLAEAQKKKKAPRGMVDPLAWAVGIHDSNLSEYEPAMPWEEEPPTLAQMEQLNKWGVWTERVTRGFAAVLLERIERRDALGLATPKQVVKLRQFGHPNAELMSKGEAGYFLGKRFGR